MQTERLIYLVTEYASGGEIFGKFYPLLPSLLFGSLAWHLLVMSVNLLYAGLG